MDQTRRSARVVDPFGLSVRDAQAVADEVGMTLIRVTAEPMDATRTVFHQHPAPDSHCQVGASIIVWTAASNTPCHYDTLAPN